MIPLSLTIKGIGPHSETTVDFSALASPVAIVAPSGTGKTTLAECIPFALFGQFAFYSSAGIYDMLTQGGTGKGSVELDFEHNGQRYRAVRTLSRTAKTTAQAASLYDGTGAMIAGPKVSDFDRAITALLGDCETFLATSFQAQKGSGDLCGNPGDSHADLVRRRKKIFDQLIGTAELDAVEKRAAVEQNTLAGALRELEAQLAGEPNYEGQINEACFNRADAQSNLETSRANLTLSESALESARSRLRDSQGDDAALTAKVEAYDRAAREVAACRGRVDALAGEVSELERRAGGLQAAREDVEKLEHNRALRAALDTQRQAHELHRAWERTLNELETAVSSISRRVRDLEAVPGVDEATVELAGRLESIRAQGIEAKTKNAGIMERNADRAMARRRIETELAGLEAKRRGIIERQGRKPVTPFGDECAPCPLMKEYAGLAGELETINARTAELTQELAAVTPDELTLDEHIAALREQWAKAEAAKKTVDGAEQTRTALDAARMEHEHARQMADAHRGKEPPKAADPGPEWRQVQAEIDRLNGAAERVKACEQAAADLGVKREAQSAAHEALDAANAALTAATGPAEDARAALLDRERARERLMSEVRGLEGDVAAGRRAVDELTAAVARHGARIEELERRAGEADAKRQRASGMRGEIEGLADVRAAFGPKGVRQILFDAALPELEAIADDLFERATGGQMRLRIATQTTLRDGSIVEDFAILVRDGRGERDVLQYSGGEQETIKVLFRFAVAEWIARLRGTTIDTLILDEPFTAFGEDADIVERFFGVLEFIRGQVQKIIIITHMRALSDALPGRVELRRGVLGVSVETGVECGEVQS